MNKHQWYKLNGFSCPVADCKGQKGSYKWKCSKHREQMYISQNGYLSCTVNGHSDKIINWRFDCGNHGDHPVEKYKHADFQGFSFALSHAVQLMNTAGTTWVGALVTELGEQYKRQGPKEPERRTKFTTHREPRTQHRRRHEKPVYQTNFIDRRVDYDTIRPYRYNWRPPRGREMHDSWCECFECRLDDLDLC